MRMLAALVAVVMITASASAQAPADQTFSGTLANRSSRVAFNVDLQEGQIVTLTTSSTQNVDTILTLNAPGGRRVAQNDDAQVGATLTSRVVHLPRASGRYTAVVTGFNGSTGAFGLHVTRGLDIGLSDAARTLREETRSFDQRRTEHRFPVDLTAGEIFVASTFALTENLDTTLTLVDSHGAILASNDDRSDGDLNSQIVYAPAASGRYEIVASTFGSNGVGDFVLSLAIDPNAEAPFNFASIHGQTIATYEGELNDAQTSREFTVNLAAGQTVLALSDATSGNLDTVMRMSGPDGFPVALNDDRGDGTLNSAFAFTAPRAATYRLELYRFQQSENSGAFRLVLTSVDASVVAQLQALNENPVTLSGAEHVIQTEDFRVYYTLEGADASTEEYARSVGEALETVLGVQTALLGWAMPVRDPDGRYRAYVADARGAMGYTKAVQIVFDNPNTANVRERAAARAVFVVDNDFANMGKKAPPDSLMRATATHELNHVVQNGYDADEGLRWLFESTASWTETATVGLDQDATDYVATDFEAPELCWTTLTRGHDYGQWTLLESLADRYGDEIVVRLWENTVPYDGFEVMERTLASVGTTTPDAIQRWRVQNFALAYDLAPLFRATVALAGSINRTGRWSPRNRVEQLGANYVALRLSAGRRSFALQGDANLELVGLGQRNGQIEVVPLGREGVFDTTDYSYAALMVFNRAVPPAPGDCRGVEYSITTANSEAPAASVQYQFSAEHFARPQ